MTDKTPAPTPAPTPKAAPKTAKYVVAGADIWTSKGRHAVGDVVDLTAAEAKHFVSVGKLEPYIPDADLEESID